MRVLQGGRSSAGLGWAVARYALSGFAALVVLAAAGVVVHPVELVRSAVDQDRIFHRETLLDVDEVFIRYSSGFASLSVCSLYPSR
jgi:hypothetical protein